MEIAIALHQPLSFLIGLSVMSFNLWLMHLSWDWVLNKKLVALGLPAIVVKYALLGFLLYQSLTLPWLNFLFFSLGMSVPVVVYMGVMARKLGKNEEQ